LQGLGPTGIPVAAPNTNLFPGEDFYHIHVGEFTLPHSEWVAGAFLQPAVVHAQSNNSGEANLQQPGPRFIQIGNEAGFTPFPVALNNPPVQFSVMNDAAGNPIASTLKYNLLMAPAERADVSTSLTFLWDLT
jgi:hypothetical protein